MNIEELLAKAEEKLTALETKVNKTADVEAKIDELKNEIADLEVKLNQRPTETKADPKQVAEMARKAFALEVKANAGNRFPAVAKEFGGMDANSILSMSVKAALNLTTTAQGLESVDEVLSRDIIERARESYPIVSSVRTRNMPRNLREEVLISYPSVVEGIENVAGSAVSETDVQRYAEVKNQVAKITAKPRITDEAMYGSDLDLYNHLLTLVSDEVGRRLANQILFGNGTGKNMRGILSSNRLDITNLTGESWKATFGAGARSADVYPALGTGVSGGLPATSVAAVNWLIDLTTTLPTAYLNSAKWYMNRRTFAAICKLRDAQDRPVFSAGYMGQPTSILGYPVVLEDYMPDLAADAPFIIFGDLMQAFSMSPGDIDKTIVDPYTVDGCTVVKKDVEYFEMVGKNDAIIVGCATTNAGA